LFAAVAGRRQTNFLTLERHAERLAQGNHRWRRERQGETKDAALKGRRYERQSKMAL
jgi:hypothetical protein